MTISRPHERRSKLDRIEHRYDRRCGLWIRTERLFDRASRKFSDYHFEYTANDISEIHKAHQSLRDFSEFFRIPPYQAKTVLEFAGINIVEQLATEYRCPTDLESLSERHGVSADTLGKWLRQHGVRVRPGRRRPETEPHEVRTAYRDGHSVSSVARHFGIAWQTAKKILDETETPLEPHTEKGKRNKAD